MTTKVLLLGCLTMLAACAETTKTTTFAVYDNSSVNMVADSPYDFILK